MAIIKSGNSDTVLHISHTTRAMNVSYFGNEVVGSYRRVLQSGSIAASTGAGVIFSFWNGSYDPPAKFIEINDISIGFRTIAGNTAGSQVISLWKGTGMSGLETTNISTAPTIKGQKLFPKSQQMTAEMIICSTAMATGASGSITEDSQALASLVFAYNGNISPLPIQSFFSYHGELGLHDYPIVLVGNEFVRIRADTAFPGGTDSVVAIVQIDWSEFSYNYYG